MAPYMVKCVKLGCELQGLDPNTSEGDAALTMAEAVGGPELRKRMHENVSLEAWQHFKNHLTMVINEYRLDPASDEADPIIRDQMLGFFFAEGEAALPPGYVPPQGKG
jgi:Fe-S cluster biosynthesis and repair protein YggX